ncbi:MAG: histidine triad nucleotide-binding protein [Chloroflexi bacterium]|nr:histidine triad nucleotide-binding protein [Chloroflexota bacterium]
MADPCIFCRILRGELPGQFAYEDDYLVAFRDIHPVAPTHVLVVPREHVESLAHASSAHRELLGRLLEAAAAVASREGLAARGYRVVINTGTDSGSEVAHLHLHVLGGRQLRAMG